MASGVAACVKDPYQAKSGAVDVRSGRVFDHRVLHDVIHGKRADPNLRDDVKELGENTPLEMRQTGDVGFENRGVIGFPGFAATVLNGGQFDEGKGGEDDEHHAAQNNVGKNQGVEIRGCAGFRFVAEEEIAAHGGRDDVGAGIERLRHRQPPRRALLRAEHGHVRICRNLNARQAGGENEQRREKAQNVLNTNPAGMNRNAPMARITNPTRMPRW